MPLLESLGDWGAIPMGLTERRYQIELMQSRTPSKLKHQKCTLVPICLALLILGFQCPVIAQTYSGIPLSTPQLPTIIPSNSGVIQFDNRDLFTVLTSGTEDAQDRAELANVRLAEALARLHAQKATDKDPQVTVSSRSGEPILLLDGSPLLTVTPSDAASTGELPQDLALTWAKQIDAAIAQAKKEYEPQYFKHALRISCFFFLIGFALHGIAYLSTRRLHVRLGWIIPTLIWFFTIAAILDLFPQLRPIVNLFTAGQLRILAVIVLVALPTATVIRIWKFIVQLIVPPIPEHVLGTEMMERKVLLRATRARALEVTVSSVLWLVAVVVGLAAYGVNISVLLTSAGLLGVALGLVLQDAIKDLVAGMYILAEDRFGVGDTIQIGNYMGVVERFSPVSTQLRDTNGRLISISNRGIVDVANLTAYWGQVDLKVGVSYYHDLAKAEEILKAVAAKLYSDWPDHVLGPPEYLGVDSFEPNSIILRLTIRTRPGLRDVVARELRGRVKRAFDSADIAMMNTLYTAPPLPANGLSAVEDPRQIDVQDPAPAPPAAEK